MPEDEEIECVACGYTSIDKTRFKLTSMWPPKSHEDPVMMCNVCRGSFAGNAYQYPSQYRGTQDILFSIAACTNMLIDEIRNVAEGEKIEITSTACGVSNVLDTLEAIK